MSTRGLRLSKKERWERILRRLGSDVTVRISALAEQFGVTTETIRRDIDALTEQGLVSRTYGGAATKSLTGEPSLLQRRREHVAEREAVARHAASLIEPGEVLMIDSGSTTYHFARALADRPMELTVVTNCVLVAQCLGGITGFRVILAPGDYSTAENGVFGQETTGFLGRFRANTAVIGAGGVTEAEVTDADGDACWVKRTMIQRAERSLLVIDHSKLGARLFQSVCPLGEIDHLVVDRKPPDRIARALKAASARLHVAGGRA